MGIVTEDRAKRNGLRGSATLRQVHDMCPELYFAIRDAYDNGYTYLGNGAFGVTYMSTDRTSVIKFSVRGKEDGWLSYAQWLLSSDLTKGNPHFPVINSLYMFTDDVYLAEMEVLSEKDKNETDMYVVRSVSGQGTRLKDWEKYVASDSNPSDLKYAAFLIGAEFGGRYSFDMHSGNFMVRESTGDTVITDPISYKAY